MAAEAIGIASGVIALAEFAFKKSVSLYQTVNSFQTNNQKIRELREELETIDRVLRKLQEACREHKEEYESLNWPLFRCGTTCNEFNALIASATTHSNSTKTSLRDWLKLQYMGDDISGFKHQLASYKVTIGVALANAVLGKKPVTNAKTRTKTAVTADFIEKFRQDTSASQDDLSGRMELISAALEDASLDDAERKQWDEERSSVVQSLEICTRALEAASNKQPSFYKDIETAEYAQLVLHSIRGDPINAENITTGTGANVMVMSGTSNEVVAQLSRDHTERVMYKLSQQRQQQQQQSDEMEGEPQYEEPLISGDAANVHEHV